MSDNKLKITNDFPTTIVADFQTFLHYLKTNQVKLTKTKQALTKKDLRALYEQLPNVGLVVGENATQANYPVINLLMELALKLELVRKTVKGSTVTLIVDEEQLQLFQDLTLIEQYVSLLQCFWLQADWKALQGALYADTPMNVDGMLAYLEELPVGKKLTLQSNRELKQYVYTYGHFLLYFEYFGFWHVTLDDEVEPKTRVVAKSIELKPFLLPLKTVLEVSFESRGDHLDQGLFSALDQLFGMRGLVGFGDEEDEYEDEVMTPAQFLAELQPVFEKGQLERILLPKEKEIKHGEYVLKVALSGSCWRTIALASTQTLFDLHEWIQRAFDFDDDHLFAFYMDGKPFSRNCYNSPNDAVGPYATEVTLGELYLEEGQRFLYLFDFGDEWRFDVTLEKIHEGVTDCVPGVRKEKGKAPMQYRDDMW